MSDDTVPGTERNPNGWQMLRFADMQTFPLSRVRRLMVLMELCRWYVPIRRWSRGLNFFSTLLAYMQTFLLPDVLEDLCSSANLRYQARSLLAQNGQKRNWHPLFVRASSETVMLRMQRYL
jgi:hypothetical protein